MRRILLPLLMLVAVTATAEDHVLITYNLLNYPGSTGPQRAPYFQLVIQSLDPDLVVCQEVQSYSGRNLFLNDILDEIAPDDWTVAPFHDGFDTDRALFYKPALFEVVDSGWLNTDLRDIDWWQLRELDSDEEFQIYSLHLKASQGSDNEQQRLAEVTVLRNHLATLPVDLPVIVAGDLNIYDSYEPAYQLMMSAGDAKLYDPISQPGNWHNNVSFAAIHTQSTRTEAFGGGATGGLDDRFDQILVTDDLLDDVDLEILPATYLAYGNDGEHFNQAIVDGTNSAVPADVANALYQSSDHLPVVVSLHFPDVSPAPVPVAPLARLDAWPNPFNPTVSLRAELARPAATDLIVYDLRGREVATIWRDRPTATNETVQWQPADLASGVYVARLVVDGRAVALQKLVLTR